MKINYSKGTWRVHDKGDSYRIVTDGFSIADVFQQYPDNGEARANAELIAAAPDLLAACKWAYALLAYDAQNGQLDSYEDEIAYQSLEAAIAKAQGGA